MDIQIIIIGSILVLICVIPFVLAGKREKNKNIKMFQSLVDLARQRQCQITEYEIIDEIVIGMDEPNLFLFFMKKTDQQWENQSIHLKEFKSCRVKNTSRAVMNTSVIEKLELELIPRDKTKKVVSLEFFNSDHSIQIVDELKAIEKWNERINGIIS